MVMLRTGILVPSTRILVKKRKSDAKTKTSEVEKKKSDAKTRN